MNKLALAVAGALFLTASAPVFACPHDDANEVKTADKDKAKDTDKAKAKDTDKAKTADKDKAKEQKPAETKPVAKS